MRDAACWFAWLPFLRPVARGGVAAALLLGGAWPAAAQLVLPGAVQPTPAGTTQAAPRPPKPRSAAGPAAPAPAVVPSPAALAGRTLLLNGGKSQLTFAAGADKRLSVTRLLLAGTAAGAAHGDCQVEAEGVPLAATPLGRPAGVERWQLAYPACPLVFDVLDGAVLVAAAQGTCTFAAQGCSVDPAGLWGPAPGDLGPDRVKAIERARGRAESSVRATYKALTATTKDRPTVMAYAKEQAQFSSTREEVCRDYAGEGRHGFCATTLTEARAAALRDMLGTALQAKAERKARRQGRAAKPRGG